jgi:excisionase family DNA binding protein
MTNQSKPSKSGTRPIEEFLTVTEVAAIFHVTKRTVRNWMKANYLSANRFGGVVRIARSEVARFVKSNRGL